MPTKILDSVEKRVASFITPLNWAKLRLFSAVDELYGIRSTLQDLSLTNVAQILQVHERWKYIQLSTVASLSTVLQSVTEISQSAN